MDRTEFNRRRDEFGSRYAKIVRPNQYQMLWPVEQENTRLLLQDEPIEAIVSSEMIIVSVTDSSNSNNSTNFQRFESVVSQDETNKYLNYLKNAILQNNPICAEILIRSGAKVAVPDSTGLTALHYAAYEGCKDILEVMLNYCNADDVDVIGSSGATPLYDAVYKNRLDIVQLLLDHGADPSRINSKQYERTSFHVACRYATDINILKKLFNNNPEIVTIADVNGILPATVLSEVNLSLAVEMARYILQHDSLDSHIYLEHWICGMDPLGRFDRALLNELQSGDYGDFLQLYEWKKFAILDKYVINKIEQEDKVFIEFLLKNDLLKITVFDRLHIILGELYKSDDTVNGAWYLKNKFTVDEKVHYLQTVLIELGYNDLFLPLYDTTESSTNDRALSLCQRERSLLLWCCFSGRYRLVKLIIRSSRFDVIRLGILACQVINYLSKHEDLSSEAVSSMKNSAMFCQRAARDALQVTGMKYATMLKKKMFQNYLQCPTWRYCNYSLFDMAVKAQCSKVLAVTSSKDIIREQWYGVLAPLQVILCWFVAFISYPLFFPFNLISWFIIAKVLSKPNDVSPSSCEKKGAAAEHLKWTPLEYKCALAKCIIQTPFVKFVQHVFTHAVFTILLCHVILDDLHLQPGLVECACYVYVASYALEEAKQISKSFNCGKLLDYARDRWNLFDGAAVFLFIVGLFCRCTICQHSILNREIEAHLTIIFWTRFFYTLSMCFFCMRLLFVYTIHDGLGSKLKMIKGMITKDLLPFLPILFFFVLPYGIAVQSLLYPNGIARNGSKQEMGNEEKWQNIFSFSFFAMVGDFQLEKLSGMDCMNGSCPSNLGSKVVIYLFLVVYILMTNVLLMNLLIALFSNTANAIDEEYIFLSVTLDDRVAIKNEFKSKSALAPPFNIVQILYELISYILCGRSYPPCQCAERRDFYDQSQEQKIYGKSWDYDEWNFMIVQAAALKGQRFKIGTCEQSMQQQIKALSKSVQKEMNTIMENKCKHIEKMFDDINVKLQMLFDVVTKEQ